MVFGFLFGRDDKWEIIITLDDQDSRPHLRRTLVPPTAKQLGTYEQCPIFRDGETVSGKVIIRCKDPTQAITGLSAVQISLHGSIEMPYERGGQSHEFTSLVTALLGPSSDDSYGPRPLCRFPFSFATVSMPYESYDGELVSLRYCLRATVKRSSASLRSERTLWVIDRTNPLLPGNLQDHLPPVPSTLEIGLQDQLHLHLRFDNTRIPMSGCISGHLTFGLLNQPRIERIELLLQRREFTPSLSNGSVSKTSIDHETLYRFVIAEGPPILSNDSMPFRFLLAAAACSTALTPSYVEVGKLFSVRYYATIVLVEEGGGQGKRYFKQQEITIYR